VIHRRIIVGTVKFVGAGLVGAAAAAVVGVVSFFLLPTILGLLVEGLLSTVGIARTALALIIASLSSWFFHMSLGNMVLAWIVATTISAVIGGFIGAFLGCLGATFVLQRARDSADFDRLEA